MVAFVPAVIWAAMAAATTLPSVRTTLHGRPRAHAARCVVAPASPSHPRSSRSERFPDAWVGDWFGTLVTLAPPDSVRNRIPITLHIAREDTGSAYTWRTVFNADTVRGVRAYRLLVRDAARGHYATDEGNGLILEETYLDGMLVSVFEVGGRVLESRYMLRGDTLTHDITWWNGTPSATIRGEGANGEAGLPVRNYRVEGRQHAVFTRRPGGGSSPASPTR